MHLVDFALDSWIEYKKYCQKNAVSVTQIFPLLDFRIYVVERGGRPSTASIPTNSPVPRRHPTEVRPFREIQRDQVDHMPYFDNKNEPTRCKLPGCK